VLTFPEIERALVVTAHPDDVDFGAAGTVATLTDAGVHVTYCLVTDGDAGGSDRSMSRHDMAMLRRREQTDAAAQVGVTDLVFLGHGDGRVQPTLQLRADISAVIRRVRPRVVISQSPDEVWVMTALNGPNPIDVTAAVDRKIAALMCHVSQHTDPQRTATMVREWMINAAKQLGLPDGAAAETFRVVDTR